MTDKTIPGYPGIWVSSNRRFGKPCIEGTRLALSEIIADAMGDATPALKSIWNLSDKQIDDATTCIYRAIIAWEEKHWAEDKDGS